MVFLVRIEQKIIITERKIMKSLKIEPKEFDKAYKAILFVFIATLIIALLYLFVLLTSASNALSLKTFLTIVITFLITTAIPYSCVKIVENAKKKDRNNALKKVQEKLYEKHSVKFSGSPSVNTVAVLINDKNERFYGVITLNEEQEPIIKLLSNYEEN